MTFADLKERVALDLEPHLHLLNGHEIAQAIADAIEFYQHERLWFLEGEDTSTTTVDGTPDYVLPADLIEVDAVTVTVSGNRYVLHRKTWTWYRDRHVNLAATKGQPTSYIIFEGKLWLYPTPDGAYQITYSGLLDLADLSADGDSNVWTTRAAEMIRAHAKAELCLSRLGRPNEAQAFAAVAAQELKRLRQRSYPRVATGYITPTAF